MSDDPLLLPAPEEPLLLPAPAEPKLLPAPGGPAGASPRGDGRSSHRFYWIAAAIFVVLLLVGLLLHWLQSNAAKEANEDARNRLPTVGVIEAKASSPTADLLLPGSISPITEASLFARASGYLRVRYVDIGDTVKRGQVLAEIDSPDLDQQVAMGVAAVAQAKQQLGQAQAAVNDSKARLALARITSERTNELGRDNAVAQQEVDQNRQGLDTATATLASSVANVGASEANVRAAEANRDRLVVLQNYEKLRAPFDGVVTARNIDVGAYINTGGGAISTSGTPMASSSEGASSTGSSGSTTGTTASSGGASSNGSAGQAGELFRIGQVDRLRVFVSVPQENAGTVEPGNDASVFVQGSSEPVDGRVTRTAKSLDPTARTLLTEVQVDNQRRLLMPGMYAQVRFHSPRSKPPLLVPGEAVIARANGLSIATIEDLRPEDRDRLPKKKPKDEDEKKNDDATKGKSAEKGGDSAKGGAAIGGSGKGGGEKGSAKGGGGQGGDTKGSQGGGDHGGSDQGGGAGKGADAEGGSDKGGSDKGGGDKGGGDKGGGDESFRERGNYRDRDREKQQEEQKKKREADAHDPKNAKRIHLQQVRVGRDYGTEVEITEGLKAGTIIVSNPGDDVAEGALVIPQMKKAPDAQSGKLGPNPPPQNNESPSMKAPTKGRS